MAMPQVQRRYTVAEVVQFPDDGNRYELIRGELHVSPAPMPRHQAVVGQLHGLLWEYLRGMNRENTLFSAPADISWDDETLVQPDLLIVPPEEVTNSWTTYRTLLLAVEVISPSSRRRDQVDKRRLYQEHRVATYWIVDPDAELVEVWQPGDDRPLVATEQLTWRLVPDSDPITIDLVALFAKLPT
jgi:Uma2 family endonuclease